MPELNIDAAQAVSELEKINQKTLQVKANMKAANAGNAASMNVLNSSIAQTTATENAYTASVQSNTMSVNINNASLMGSTSQLMQLNAQLLTATANMNAFTSAWNLSTMAVNMNNIAVATSTAMLAINTMTRMQGTMGITADTVSLSLNSMALMMNSLELTNNTLANTMNTLASNLNTASRLMSSMTAIENTAQIALNSAGLTINSGLIDENSSALSKSTAELKSNALAGLMTTLTNAANAIALHFFNGKLSDQYTLLQLVNSQLKANAKYGLIAALATLGNWLATLLVNSGIKKGLPLTREQLIMQNKLNGALAAAAILKNPLVGLATVAGAALAQGLMGGQEVEQVSIDIGGESQYDSRDIAMAETFKSGTGGSSESGMLTDITSSSSEKFSMSGSASLNNMPKLATGGVVTRATMAMIGEGRYDEAVIPLGNSPQMTIMKNDIANAVVQSLLAVQSMNRTNNHSNTSGENIILNMDGQKVAQILLPKIAMEQRKRSGYKVI